MSRLARAVSEVELGSLLPLLSAFAWWNGSPRSFPQTFHIVQDFATLSSGEGQREATTTSLLPVAQRIHGPSAPSSQLARPSSRVLREVSR